MKRSRSALIFIACLFASRSSQAADALPPEDATLRDLLPLWDQVVTVQTGGGYNDNVLLNRDRTERSAFWSANLDLVIWRIPTEGYELQFIGSGDYRSYTGGDAVKDEVYTFGQAQYRRTLGADWQAEITADASYQDRVVSAISIGLTTNQGVSVRGVTVGITPALQRDFGPAGQVETAFLGSGYYFQEGSDNFDIYGPRITYTFPYTARSKVALLYSFSRVAYEERAPLYDDGSPIPGGQKLRLLQHLGKLSWQHFWREQNGWNLTADAAFQATADNGGGYYDYYRVRGGVGFGYAAEQWKVSVTTGLSHYFYAVQKGDDFVDDRRRLEWTLGIHLERRFTKWLRAVLDFDREFTHSNLLLETYSANVIRGALSWEF